jgi:hypothetical protein
MTKATRILVGTLGTTLLLGSVAYGLLTSQKPDDTTLIQQAVKDALAKSRNGEPGGILDLMSAKIQFNGTEYDGSKSSIADFVKKNRPEITFANTSPEVTSDSSARIETSAKMKFALGPLSHTVDVPNVVIRLTKESHRSFLLIPRDEWKVSSVDAEFGQLPDLSSFGL